MNQSKIGPMPLSAEWLELHRKIITATDIAAILGQSEYKTPLDVFLEKTGRLPPFEGNEHTRRGNRYEPVILADYAEARGVEVKNPLPFRFHPTLEFLGATPDGQRQDNGNLVEAKFSMSRTRANELGEENTDNIPSDWLFQAQTQALCWDVEEVDFAVLLFGKLKIYNVRRNEKLGEVIEEAAYDMFRRIQTDDAPEPDWQNRHTPDLIRNMYGVDEGKVILLDGATGQQWAEYRDLGDQIKALDEKRDIAKAKVLHAMGEAAVGLLPAADVELIRSTVTRKSYTVAETSYITLRQRKVKSR